MPRLIQRGILYSSNRYVQCTYGEHSAVISLVDLDADNTPVDALIRTAGGEYDATAAVAGLQFGL